MQNAIQTKSNKQHTTSPPPPPVNHRSVLSSLIRPVHVNLLSSSLSVKRRGIELNRRCKDRTMEHYSSPGGTWTMIPTPNSNPQIQSQSQSQSNQDPNLYLQQQQQQFLQQQQPFQQPQTTQSQFQQQQQLYQQQQQQQRILQQQQQQQPPQQQQNLHQSLASHFHLLNLVENLAEVVEHGNPDQQSDALITELSNHFEKCQQLLNSISASISTKAMLFGCLIQTVEGQKKKLEESEQLLNQRRDLISNYTKSVEELVRSEP